MADRLVKQLLIVGWDGADWKVIDALLRQDAMPNVRRVVQAGVRANLASMEPRLSPLLWTSIATGKTPDRHGILNFVEPEPAGSGRNGMRIASSTTRTTKALWNILTQSGMRVNVVNWYASHPAEPIHGVCVSNLFQEGSPRSQDEIWPMAAGAVHPPEWIEPIARCRMSPSAVTAEMLLPLVPRLSETGPRDPRPALLARHISQCASIHNAVTTILSGDDEWDCTMVFFDTIDSVGHNFMQYHPPRMAHIAGQDYELYRNVMTGLYQFQDVLLGVLLDLVGNETVVILLSDHGFYSDHRRPVITATSPHERAMVESAWHRHLGMLAMAGPGIKQDQQIYGARLLDITPTALVLLGLPTGADMNGRPLLEAFDRAIRPETVLSWDIIAGDAGMHPADLRQDPFEARDAIRQLIDLGYLPELPEAAEEKAELARRESQCNLGTVYLSSGQPERAVRVFEELLAKYPEEQRFTHALAQALLAVGDFRRCANMLRAFQREHPERLEAKILLVTALAAGGEQVEAAELLTQLEQECAGRMELEAALGGACLVVNNWQQAERHLRRATEHNPDGAPLYLGMARALIGLKRFEEAIEASLKAVELVHVFPDAHHTLGVALTWIKDYDHAIKAFQVALSMRPGLLDSHRYLATIYRYLGDSANARKHREIAERLISEAKSGHVSIDFLKREAPMGPQEWARTMGLASEAADDAGS